LQNTFTSSNIKHSNKKALLTQFVILQIFDVSNIPLQAW